MNRFTPPSRSSRRQFLSACAWFLAAGASFTGLAQAADPDDALTAEINGQTVEQLIGKFDIHQNGTGTDLVIALVPRPSAWKLVPEPSFKFQKLEGAQAEQTVRYALLYDFVATSVAAGGVRIASLFAPRNPTPSGSSAGVGGGGSGGGGAGGGGSR